MVISDLRLCCDVLWRAVVVRCVRGLWECGGREGVVVRDVKGEMYKGGCLLVLM